MNVEEFLEGALDGALLAAGFLLAWKVFEETEPPFSAALAGAVLGLALFGVLGRRRSE